MGKDSAIKSLARVIGNVVMHRLLLRHTNFPESRNHLSNEIAEYGADAFEKAQEFNWNEKDKEEIKIKAIERVKNLSENYPDVKFETNELEDLIEMMMDELF